MLKQFQFFSVVSALFFSITASSKVDPQINAFSAPPVHSMVTLSPDGSRVAFRAKTAADDAIVVLDRKNGQPLLIQAVENIQPVALFFASNERLILKSFKNLHRRGHRGRNDETFMHVIALNGDKSFQLVTANTSRQIGSGNIIAIAKDKKSAFVPAYESNGDKNVYRTSLERKRKLSLVKRGGKHAINFIMYDEEVVAIEYYNDKTNEHKIDGKYNGEWKEIYNKVYKYRTIAMEGITEAGDALVIKTYDSDIQQRVYAIMSLKDGSISAPIFSNPNHDAAELITDNNRIVYGARYKGFKASYQFLNPQLDASIQRLLSRGRNNTFYLESFTDDWKHAVFLMEGDGASGQYLDYSDGNLALLAHARPSIGENAISPVRTFEYTARDGLKLPALMILPKGKELQNLPAIVLAHGGPSSHDTIGFDWLGQYFASLGILVIQPQFRGSDGFGMKIERAGDGEWGRKMQSDLSDAMHHLAKQNFIDPERVCIVGASYGGYAALAGATLSPDDYACAVSINGISDINSMLDFEEREHGVYHSAVSYWQDVIKAKKHDIAYVKKISPINNIKNVNTPILLLHGEHDMSVPVEQSEEMFAALKKQKKAARFVELEEGSHYLTKQESRLTVLTEIDRFIRKYLLNQK